MNRPNLGTLKTNDLVGATAVMQDLMDAGKWTPDNAEACYMSLPDPKTRQTFAMRVRVEMRRRKMKI